MVTQKIADITVIIVIYNDEVFGKRAIESVLDQTHKKIKIKILNNGSTDGSGTMIERFSSDPRVEIITNPKNQRSEFACRKALETDTEYLCFLFSDDFYEKERIETMLAVLKLKPNAAAVFSNNNYVTNELKEIKSLSTVQLLDVSKFSAEEHIQKILLIGNTLHPCAMTLRTAAYKEIGGFKGYLHRIGDMNFFTSLLLKYEVAFISDKLQRITTWENGRNESSRNTHDYFGLFFERSLFLESFKSPEALQKVSMIFPELSSLLHDQEFNRAERLFYMGYKITQVDSIDYVSVGARFLFEAYETDPERVEEICENNYQTSFSQLSYRLSNREWKGPEAIIYKVKSFLKRQRFIFYFYERFFKKKINF